MESLANLHADRFSPNARKWLDVAHCTFIHPRRGGCFGRKRARRTWIFEFNWITVIVPSDSRPIGPFQLSKLPFGNNRVYFSLDCETDHQKIIRENPRVYVRSDGTGQKIRISSNMIRSLKLLKVLKVLVCLVSWNESFKCLDRLATFQVVLKAKKITL